ncbi:MAG: hypothetical protein HN337_03675 [Deltaproteobacteria bacterium]|jgi:hypothetical protein|nr:hypothetical protein [Deltaproteobacteria bacterium]
MLAKFILFGMIGICGSLAITAFKKTVISRKLELTGETSVILFPIYGLIGLIYPLIAIHLGDLTWYLRGVIYTIVFYIFQYVSGLLLTKIKLCPWSYSSRWSFQGLIRIEDAPIWFFAGLAVEWIYPYVKAVAGVL